MNAKNRKCHCGYSETPTAVKKRKQRQNKAEKRLKETERKRKYRNKVKTSSQMIMKTVFPIGCRKAGPYNQ